MNKGDIAAANLAGHTLNCAQSVLMAFCEDLGLEKSQAFKVALAFGGGMGGTGKTCGAVTGALMVMGLKLGSREKEVSRETLDSLVKEFKNRFAALHGSTECNDLLGIEINTAEGSRLAHEKGVFDTICPKLVRSSAEILEEMEGQLK
jgi:C_GCAxxG_C_C family probable redox protein